MKEIKRTDDIYVEIENFQDYELTNNIAYEMLIRNDEARLLYATMEEFSVLITQIGYFHQKESDDIKQNIEMSANQCFALVLMRCLGAYAYIGQQTSAILDQSDIFQAYRTLLFVTEKEDFKYYDYKKFAHLNAKELLKAIGEELIYFEQEFNRLALFISTFDDIEKFKEIQNITIDSSQIDTRIRIINHPDGTSDIIEETSPKKAESLFYIKKCPAFTISSELADRELLSDLSADDLAQYLHNHPYQAISKYVAVESNFSRPTVKNQHSKIADISINLSLPIKDIVAYITEIKKEFDRNINLVKSPLDLALGDFSSEQENIVDISSHISKQMKLANMFFIYDAFKAGYKMSYIKQEIDNYFYSEKMENFVDIKKSANGFDPKTIRRYHQLACEYINDKKYITLISSTVV